MVAKFLIRTMIDFTTTSFSLEFKRRRQLLRGVCRTMGGERGFKRSSIRQTLAAAVAVAIVSLGIPAIAQTAPVSDALFQDLGGQAGIQAIVADFLPIVLADVRIMRQFEDVDLEHLAKMLGQQFCDLSGGPCRYAGKDMKTIHADLHITNAQFNALAEDLQTAMDRRGISARAQNKLIARLAPMQHSIVTK